MAVEVILVLHVVTLTFANFATVKGVDLPFNLQLSPEQFPCQGCDVQLIYRYAYYNSLGPQRENQIIWTFGGNTVLIVKRVGIGLEVDSATNPRIRWAGPSDPGTITITDVQASDSGDYRCQVFFVSGDNVRGTVTVDASNQLELKYRKCKGNQTIDFSCPAHTTLYRRRIVFSCNRDCRPMSGWEAFKNAFHLRCTSSNFQICEDTGHNVLNSRCTSSSCHIDDANSLFASSCEANRVTINYICQPVAVTSEYVVVTTHSSADDGKYVTGLTTDSLSQVFSQHTDVGEDLPLWLILVIVLSACVLLASITAIAFIVRRRHLATPMESIANPYEPTNYNRCDQQPYYEELMHQNKAGYYSEVVTYANIDVALNYKQQSPPFNTVSISNDYHDNECNYANKFSWLQWRPVAK